MNNTQHNTFRVFITFNKRKFFVTGTYHLSGSNITISSIDSITPNTTITEHLNSTIIKKLIFLKGL